MIVALRWLESEQSFSALNSSGERSIRLRKVKVLQYREENGDWQEVPTEVAPREESADPVHEAVSQ